MLAEWMNRLSAGSVVGIRSEDPGAFVANSGVLLESCAVNRRIVTCCVTKIYDQAGLLKTLVSCLADAALLLWPDWFNGRIALGDELDGSTITSIAKARLREFGVRIDENWLQRSVRECRVGQTPILDKVSFTIQARQLSRCLQAERLCIVVALLTIPPDDFHLDALVRAAQWLAHEAEAEVALVLPSEIASSERLSPLAIFSEHALKSVVETPAQRSNPTSIRGEFEQPSEVQQLSRFEGNATTHAPDSNNQYAGSERKYLVQPIIGRPHPASPGEQLLAKTLANDTELAGLFQFNHPIWTIRQSRFLVDLIWAAGRVVVEVDGFRYHGSPFAFITDRNRDYELLISGYVVLRLPHDEVMSDPELAVEKIRDGEKRKGTC